MQKQSQKNKSNPSQLRHKKSLERTYTLKIPIWVNWVGSKLSYSLQNSENSLESHTKTNQTHLIKRAETEACVRPRANQRNPFYNHAKSSQKARPKSVFFKKTRQN